MRYIVCGGRDRSLSPLDMAVMAAIHRPEAHPFLAGLRRRLMALEPRWPWAQPIDAVYQGAAPGIDSEARSLAQRLGAPTEDFPYLSQFGRAGGPVRNEQMRDGVRGEERLQPADAVLAFGGGAGTASMVRLALEKNLPVLDISKFAGALLPYQRWSKEDGWLVRSDRQRCLELQRERPGVGPPIVSGHWLKVNGEVVIRKWCLYVGRTSNGLTGHPWLANPFPVKPQGAGVYLVRVGAETVRCSAEQALSYYRKHLLDLCNRDARFTTALAQIVMDRRILVCWCGDAKPCHACVIAEYGVNSLAALAVVAACTPAPT